MLTPQHQQQLMLAQNLTSASANDIENRRLRLLLNKSMSLGKEGLANSVGDLVPNVGSPLQAGCPVLPRGDADMLLKVWPFSGTYVASTTTPSVGASLRVWVDLYLSSFTPAIREADFNIPTKKISGNNFVKLKYFLEMLICVVSVIINCWCYNGRNLLKSKKLF